MLEIETKLLRDARAGYYSPDIFGLIRGFLWSYSRLPRTIIPGPETTVLDISFYQSSADFQKMKNNGVGGVIIRAGQNKWVDTHANNFMSAARDAKMPIGSYWFYDSRVDPRTQVDIWKEVLSGYDTPLYCWADYEENYGGPFGGWKNLYNFLELCKREMPTRKFGIYTGYYYWLEHCPTTTAELNYFGRYPLWEAWYTSDPSIVKIPKPWTELTFWQKSAKGDGTKYGVGSLNVDVNSFLGTEQQFNDLFGLESEPTTGGTMQVIRGVAKQNVLTRTGPSTDYSVVNWDGSNNYIRAGSAIEAVYPNQAQWLNITKVNGLPVSAPLVWSSAGASQQYIGWDVITIPDEPPPTPEPTPLPSVLYVATKEDMTDKVKYVKEV